MRCCPARRAAPAVRACCDGSAEPPAALPACPRARVSGGHWRVGRHRTTLPPRRAAAGLRCWTGDVTALGDALPTCCCALHAGCGRSCDASPTSSRCSRRARSCLGLCLCDWSCSTAVRTNSRCIAYTLTHALSAEKEGLVGDPLAFCAQLFVQFTSFLIISVLNS